MKPKPVYLTALVLAVVLSTGCKHELVGVRPIRPGMLPNVAEVGPGNTVPQGEQPIPLETSWNPEMMDQDKATLAADTVHFSYDSAVMRSSERANLKTVALTLQADPGAKLLVEGNCDERGTEEYNRSLGERRALSSREALAALGIDPMRICTISYGKDKPVDRGHDEAAWRKNRRDDFVLLHPKTGIGTNTVSDAP